MGEERKRVASVSDVPGGKHKAFDFAGKGDDAVQVLISHPRGDGKLYATSAKCTHYGAPLANGVLTSTGRVVCPWHGACFDVKTGDIEDAPALDNILSLKLEVEGDDIYVTADAEKLKGKPGVAPGCKGSVSAASNDTKGLVIVGGGSGAINVIEAARKAGYSEPITLLTAEAYPPIDRTKLSKGLITDSNAVAWRSKAHLENVLKVQLHEKSRVASVDVKGKSVQLEEGGKSIGYDALVLATGGTPRRLPVEGAKEGQLKNVFTLREVGDSANIVGALGDKGDKSLVVVGSSFIGCEAAIAVAGQKKAKQVAVVGMEKQPFERVLGAEVGAGLRAAQEKSNGIKFYMEAGVERLEGDGSGNVKSVIIKDSDGKEQTLAADVVILGVGVAPATTYLKSSAGFPELQKDGSVEVDGQLRVKGLPQEANVFAIGDIATHPSRDASKSVRVEHWNVAGNHGRAVGKLLAGSSEGKEDFNKLPIFWSALGSQLRYVSDGNGSGFDGVHLDGNPAEQKFAAYYYKGDTITAVAS